MHCSKVDGAGSIRSLLGVCVGGVSEELLVLLMQSGVRATLRTCTKKTTEQDMDIRRTTVSVPVDYEVKLSRV